MSLRPKTDKYAGERSVYTRAQVRALTEECDRLQALVDAAPTLDQIEEIRSDVNAALERNATTVRERNRLQAALWALIDIFEGAIREFDSRGAGGQHVPYHGDFRAVGPSTVEQMRRWARDLRSALKGEWPPLRDEYKQQWPETSEASLDALFPEREP